MLCELGTEQFLIDLAYRNTKKAHRPVAKENQSVFPIFTGEPQLRLIYNCLLASLCFCCCSSCVLSCLLSFPHTMVSFHFAQEVLGNLPHRAILWARSSLWWKPGCLRGASRLGTRQPGSLLVCRLPYRLFCHHLSLPSAIPRWV